MQDLSENALDIVHTYWYAMFYENVKPWGVLVRLSGDIDSLNNELSRAVPPLRCDFMHKLDTEAVYRIVEVAL